MSQTPNIFWFSELRIGDSSKVGAKAALLGELTSLDIPVPNGFVIGAQAYFNFLAQTGLQEKLQDLLKNVDIHDSSSLFSISSSAQSLITQAALPEEILNQLELASRRLSSKAVYLAVRPSVSNIDAASNVFDGNHLSKLNVFGLKSLGQSVLDQWTIAFQPRNLYYLHEHGMDPLRLPVSVIIQRMIEPEVSGVLFTSDPLHPSDSIAAIEAIWGLGEPLVEGQLVPDHYHVNTVNWSLATKEISRQDWQLVRNPRNSQAKQSEANKRLPVSVSWRKKQKLADSHIIKLAKVGAQISKHLDCDQDIEWVFAHNSLFIVQSRPSTPIPGLSNDQPSTASTLSNPGSYFDMPPLLSGAGVSPGNICGSAHVMTGTAKTAPPPDSVLFLSDIDTEHTPKLDNVLAVVIDSKLSRNPFIDKVKELGIPMVVGVINGTRMVRSGETVTVDGTHGIVYEGHVHLLLNRPRIKSAHARVTHASSPILGHIETKSSVNTSSMISTATKLYLNISEPDSAIEYAEKDVDGVGLLRAEYVINYLGEHPMHLKTIGKESAFIDALSDGLKLVAKSFGTRPVIYRLSDLSSNQYHRLNGGEDLEVREDNPMTGYRGAYRFINEPELLKLELSAIKKARQYYKNISIMLPMVRTPHELVSMKNLLAEEGLHRGGSFKLHMMIEVPSNVLLLDQFIGVGIDGVTIDTNDLTQSILGFDRHNPRVAAGFDERQDAVMLAMEQVVRSASRHGITSSISGQAPSAYPELTRKLVEWGISSISVAPDAATATRRLIADAEFELIRQGKIIKHGR